MDICGLRVLGIPVVLGGLEGMNRFAVLVLVFGHVDIAITGFIVRCVGWGRTYNGSRSGPWCWSWGALYSPHFVLPSTDLVAPASLLDVSCLPFLRNLWHHRWQCSWSVRIGGGVKKRIGVTSSLFWIGLHLLCQWWKRVKLGTPRSSWYYLGGMVSLECMYPLHCSYCNLHINGFLWQLALEGTHLESCIGVLNHKPSWKSIYIVLYTQTKDLYIKGNTNIILI